MENVLRRTINSELDRVRLDRALAALFPDMSRSGLSRAIDEGAVSIDGVVASKRSEAVRVGQQITVRVAAPSEARLAAEELPLDILYQDDDLVVINKPAGIVVHPAAGHASGTLVNALLHHVNDLSGIGGEIRPGILHRLDKDTSGVMVVAKSDSAHRALTSAWGSDAVEKEYLAVVYGMPKKTSGKIEAPIGRHPSDRKKMAVVERGRAAVTLYRVEQQLPHVSLLRCRLKTGRTHQIRVHLKHLGHPIVGDPLYSGPQWRGIPDKRIQKALAAFDRQALHAVRLTFPHPRSGEAVTFEAEMPEDMQQLLAVLRNS